MNETTLVLIVIAAIVIALIAWVIKTTNKFTDLKTDIDKLNSDIGNYREQKIEAINDAIGMAREAVGQERSLLNVGEDANNLLALGEKYPQLQSIAGYNQTVSRSISLQKDISSSKTIYNSKVSEYNKAIKIFPNCIVASMFHIEKAEFIDEASFKDNVTNNYKKIEYRDQ